MTDKNNKRKTNPLPYDNKIEEQCPKCSDNVCYRKRSYFGNTVYYKVCNSCGWYSVVEENEWIKITTNGKKSKKTKAAKPE